jgi:enoyl-[acyl-carrier protein] reductase III
MIAPVSPRIDFTDRVCVVTGATGGLGSALCERFHAAGATVVIHYLRNADRARGLAGRLGGPKSERVLVLQANLAEEAGIEELIGRVGDRLGRIDTLVHSASLGAFQPLTAMETAHWDLTMAVHTRALWLCACSARDLLLPGSSVIAISSLGARRFTPAYGAVGVAKAALEGLVRYLAAELDLSGVRVNGIAGGPVSGERVRSSPVHAALAAAAAERPGGRFAAPEELADAAVLLASPLARWIQGQVIVVDGGFSLW